MAIGLVASNTAKKRDSRTLWKFIVTLMPVAVKFNDMVTSDHVQNTVAENDLCQRSANTAC